MCASATPNKMLGSHLLGLNVDGADGDEKVEARDDVARILYKLVEILDGVFLLELVDEVAFQVPQLLGDGDVY